MNPRTRFFRGVALVGVLGLGLAACEDTTVTTPVTPTISASPASIDINVGQTQAIVATLTGVEGGVTFESLAPSIATVTASGNTATVTGVAAGNATIRVYATSQPTLQTAVGVKVNAVTIPPTETPDVVISAVTVGNTAVPINPQNVAGQIDVAMTIERGQADSLKVFLGNVEITGCTQRFGTGASAITGDLKVGAVTTTFVCPINTAFFNPTTGVPRNLNGVVTLRAVLYDNNAVAAQASIGSITLNNQDTFAVTTTTSGPNGTNPATGLLWRSGSVTATALPVMFSGRTAQSVTFAIADNDNGAIYSTRTDATAPFSVTFPATGTGSAPGVDGGVAGIEDDIAVYVSASVASGQTGPTTAPTTAFPQPDESPLVMNLDNAAPTATSFQLPAQSTTTGVLCCSNNWIGASFTFSAAHIANEADAGSGLGTITFHVGPATETNAQIAARPAVTGAAALDATTVNTTLRAVAVIRDNVGNSLTIALSGNATNPLTTLGVDKTPPTISFSGASVVNMTIWNEDTGAPAGVNFQVAISDDVSGFGTNPVLASLQRLFPGLTASAQCVAPGVFSTTAGCQLRGSTGTTAVPATAGYYIYSAVAVDQAGNLSSPTTSPISRIVLVDLVDPNASNIAIPASLTGGAATTFTATATDNLNLWRGDYRFEFGGGAQLLPFTQRQIFNQRWVTSQSQLVTEAQAAVTVNFVRSLETAGGGTPDGTGTALLASGVTLLVEDAASNFFVRSNAFAGGTVAAPTTSFTARGVQTFQVATPSAATTLWNGTLTQPAGTSTSTTITATATGASGTFANPFSTVYFYRDAVGGVTELIGVAGAPTVTDDGVTRTWTWSTTLTSAGLAAQAGVPVFAVGVHSSGDGLISDDNVNISIVDGV